MGRVNRIVIVGGGQAGGQALDSLRREGFDGRLYLVTAEDSPPYQRPPLSKDYLAGSCGIDRVQLYPDTFYSANSIELMPGIEVDAIDPGARRIEFGTGQRLDYDRLLLATGSQARRLGDLPGSRLDGIHYLRTIEDSDRIRAAMRGAGRMVVVGGGYIGLEVASVAVEAGLAVTVVESSPRLLSRVATIELSRFYADLHRRRGVELRLGATVTGFRGARSVCSVALSDGGEIPVDLVVAGIGIEPETGLARGAGLDCDNGIAVDGRCRTSAPDVFAAGDCTSQPNSYYGRRVRLESVPNALEQAQAAAAAMLGRERGRGSEPWFWSDQHGVRLQMTGHAEGRDRTVMRESADSGSFVAFHLRDGVLIGADAVDSMREFAVCRRLVAARSRPDPDALADPSVPVKALLRRSAVDNAAD